MFMSIKSPEELSVTPLEKAKDKEGYEEWKNDIHSYLQEHAPNAEKKLRKNKMTFTELCAAQAYISNRTSLTNAKKILIELMRNDTGIQDLFRDVKFKARIVGYTFFILQQNCHGSNMKAAEDFLSEIDGFNYEDEIISASNWMLPLSGSLYNDVRANFVAKKAKEMPVSQAIDLLERMLEKIIDQATNSVLSSFDYFAGVPFYLADVKKIESYGEEGNVSLLLSLKNGFLGKENEFGAEKQRIEAFRNINNSLALDGHEKFFYVNACCPPTLQEAVVPGNPFVSGYDTRLLPADVASHEFCAAAVLLNNPCENVVFVNKMKTKIIEAVSDRTWDSISPDVSQEMMENDAALQVASVLGHLCDRERLEWERQRSEIIKRRKAEKKNLQTKAASEQASANVEALKKEIAELKASLQAEKEKSAAYLKEKQKQETHAHHMEKQNEKLNSRLTEMTKTIQDLTAANSNLQEKHDELGAIVNSTRKETAEPLPENNGLDVSIFDNLNVVCYGGFPVWVQNMRTLHPNIVFYTSDGPMPEDVIENSDVVWLQTNSMSHGEYDRLIAKARLLDKPVKYFAYAGHAASKRQMVRDTQALFAKNNE